MSLASGTRLGPYEIIAPLGVGGMGEVYRARDTRLDRTVAIKISAERFSERFGREAHAIAALNHSNICHLYDVGPNYLVMEYVEGVPLKSPLPLQKRKTAIVDATVSKQIVQRTISGCHICSREYSSRKTSAAGPRATGICNHIDIRAFAVESATAGGCDRK